MEKSTFVTKNTAAWLGLASLLTVAAVGPCANDAGQKPPVVPFEKNQPMEPRYFLDEKKLEVVIPIDSARLNYPPEWV